MRSSQAFAVVKLIGAAYLIGLGLLMLWQARRGAATSQGRQLPWNGHHAYPQAVLANVLNPKAAAVYLTLAPQSAVPHRHSAPAEHRRRDSHGLGVSGLTAPVG